jgi:magnesium-transporting ATPase (P-type)
MISLGYGLAYLATHDLGIARTVSFTVTLMSPQLYAFVLRDGNLFAKIMTPNLLLKGFFIGTLVMMAAIIYVPLLNAIFFTKPIYAVNIWIIMVLCSLATPVLRLGLNKILKI